MHESLIASFNRENYNKLTHGIPNSIVVSHGTSTTGHNASVTIIFADSGSQKKLNSATSVVFPIPLIKKKMQ